MTDCTFVQKSLCTFPPRRTMVKQAQRLAQGKEWRPRHRTDKHLLRAYYVPRKCSPARRCVGTSSLHLPACPCLEHSLCEMQSSASPSWQPLTRPASEPRVSVIDEAGKRHPERRVTWVDLVQDARSVSYTYTHTTPMCTPHTTHAYTPAPLHV